MVLPNFFLKISPMEITINRLVHMISTSAETIPNFKMKIKMSICLKKIKSRALNEYMEELNLIDMVSILYPQTHVYIHSFPMYMGHSPG